MTPKGTIVPGAGGKLFALVRLDNGAYKAEVDLDTTDLAVARQRQRRYVTAHLAKHPPGVPLGRRKRFEVSLTIDQVATKHYADRVRLGKKEALKEKRWYELHLKEHLGALQPRSVTAATIEEVLLKCSEKGLSSKSLEHLRGEISKLMKSARKQKLVDDNPMELVELPDGAIDDRVRAQLTDAEFLTWALFPSTLDFSEVENEGRIERGEQPLISREIQTLGVLARTIGGMRASDCHALTWERIDFAEMCIRVLRPKVSKRKKKQGTRIDEYEIPEPVLPFLVRWWHDHGRPTSGPVFPACLPGRYHDKKREYGGHKTRMGYSAKLRRDLLTVGITRHELHEPTETTLPVGFHDFRRAFVSALRRAGVDARTAMALASHKSWGVHQLYDTASKGPMVIPGAVVPLPAMLPAPANEQEPIRQVDDDESSQITECPRMSDNDVRHGDHDSGSFIVEPRGIEPLTS